MQEMWQIRKMITLGMLGVCTYTDIKERSVYVAPLVISVTGSLAVLFTAYCFIPGCSNRALLADGILYPVFFLLFMVMISNIRQSHVGAGDGLMIVACSLTVGMKNSFFVLGVALLSAAVFAVLLIFRRKRRNSFPFAPFVMTGFAVMLLYEI